MDIHKPKPVRSWRELLTEIGIIVLSVCIALAAEQGVEWWHWRNEVAQARQAIYAEITVNNTAFFARRIAYAPCLERQAIEAGRILDDLEAKVPPGRFTSFHAGAHSVLNENEWQSERSAQSLTHFPRKELAQMGRHYAILPLFRGWLDQETDAWNTLSVLRHPPKDLAAGDLLPLRKALATAKWTERLIVLNAGRQLRLGRRLGIADTLVDRRRVEKYCTLDDDEWLQYLQSLEPRQ